MAAVWRSEDPLTVHQVIDDLGGEEVAYTTAITVIERLREKGWLSRERSGRAYRYTATRSEEEYTASLMASALDGSSDRSAALLSFAGTLDPGEAEELRRALASGGEPEKDG